MPFGALLEKIILTVVSMPEVGAVAHAAARLTPLPSQSDAFRKPVQAKVVPDYYNVIKFPMDLQTVREVRTLPQNLKAKVLLCVYIVTSMY